MADLPVLIINGSAGYGSQEHIIEVARQRGYILRYTEKRGHGMALARDEASNGTPLVIACGGDGTVNEVASGLLQVANPPPMGIIPSGIGNDLCKSLDIGEDIQDAFFILDENVQMEIDVAKLVSEDDEVFFFNVSSCGFSGEVDRHLEETDKNRWGSLSYVRSGISALADMEPFRVGASSDDEYFSADVLNVIIGNGRFAASGIPVASKAKIDDGKLDLVLYMGQGISDQIFNSHLIMSGEQERSDTIHSLRASKFTLNFSKSVSVNYDGELHGRDVNTITYSIHSKRLRLIVGRNHI